MTAAYDWYKISIKFEEDLLGTAPMDKEVYSTYIATKKADLTPDEFDDEIETINEDKGVTGFHSDENGPFLYDYMVKGFLKDACGMLRTAEGTFSSKIKAYKKTIDGLVFVKPRKIYLNLQDGEEVGIVERPLRAETPRGPRVALSKSEFVPAGTTIEFTIKIYSRKDISEELLREWFDYGLDRGMGQWRNATWGSFSYEMSAVDEASA